MKKFSEKELENYALEKSKNIVVRYYVKGNSNDVRITPANNENEINISDVIFAAIYGALLSINGEYSPQRAAANTAEFIANIATKKYPISVLHESDGEYYEAKINGYDSVYRPIMDFDFE